MKKEVILPEVSEGIIEAVVVVVNVAVGDVVVEEQSLLELETDKAVVEIPSLFAGVVSEVRVREGDTVLTGDVIVVIETEDAAAEESEPESPEVTATGTTSEDPEIPPATVASAEIPPESPAEPAVEPQPEEKPVAAAPSVRRKARELGVDIARVAGSGPAGRISKDDVRQHVRQAMQSSDEVRPIQHSVPAPDALPDFSRWGTVRAEPLSRVRQVTANAMSSAWSNIPMVNQNGQARITAFETFRKEFNSQADRLSKLTMTALLVKICAAALRHFPQFNSSLDLANEQLILKEYVHIGVAVDTPAGLLVPVLRDVDRKDIETLAIELNGLAEKARARKLTPDEMEGGCFTISNLGGIGRDSFTPIVYPPQVAILGVARGRHEPVWNGQDFVPEMVLPLTLTYDHRVVDGADGARFMQWICQAIEYHLQLVMKG